MIDILGIALITFTAGFIGSLIGLGGGFIIVPLLIILLDLPMHKALSISLASVAATALSAFIVYSRKGLVDYKLGIGLESFTLIGAILGSFIALRLSEQVLKILFAFALFFISYRMLKGHTLSLIHI